MPPTFKRNDEVLASFVDLLPEGTRAAFEFRHDSWHDESVFDCLRRRNLALCVADSEKMSTPVVTTADYAYFRLRDEGYEDQDMVRWASIIAGLQDCETPTSTSSTRKKGKGPLFAAALGRCLSGQG